MLSYVPSRAFYLSVDPCFRFCSKNARLESAPARKRGRGRAGTARPAARCQWRPKGHSIGAFDGTFDRTFDWGARWGHLMERLIERSIERSIER